MKFLENNLLNKDSLLEKIKLEIEELHKKLKKFEIEQSNILDENKNLLKM